MDQADEKSIDVEVANLMQPAPSSNDEEDADEKTSMNRQDDDGDIGKNKMVFQDTTFYRNVDKINQEGKWLENLCIQWLQLL